METFVIDLIYRSHVIVSIKDIHKLLIIKIIYGDFCN